MRVEIKREFSVVLKFIFTQFSSSLCIIFVEIDLEFFCSENFLELSLNARKELKNWKT